MGLPDRLVQEGTDHQTHPAQEGGVGLPDRLVQERADHQTHPAQEGGVGLPDRLVQERADHQTHPAQEGEVGLPDRLVQEGTDHQTIHPVADLEVGAAGEHRGEAGEGEPYRSQQKMLAGAAVVEPRGEAAGEAERRVAMVAAELDNIRNNTVGNNTTSYIDHKEEQNNIADTPGKGPKILD